MEMKPKTLHATKIDASKESSLKKKLEAHEIRLPLGEFHYVPFARMLAKIAHAHTDHELGGLDKFKPCLTNHILGKPDRTPLSQFIGNPNLGMDILDGNGKSLLINVEDGEWHRLTLMQGFGCYQVYIQLFGVFDMPPYFVVTGTSS